MLNAVHVYPLNDIVEHELEGDGCVCGPTPEIVEGPDGEDEWVLTHHALDGRERYE